MVCGDRMMHSPTADDMPPPEISDNARLPVGDPPGTPPPPEPPVDEQPASGIGAVRVIAVIFSLAACWLASDLLVPVMLAMMLALLGNPLVSRLARMWIPRWLGSLVVVVGGLVLAVWLSSL